MLVQVDKYPNGSFVGPTVLTEVPLENPAYVFFQQSGVCFFPQFH
jgi:hypothetical protein